MWDGITFLPNIVGSYMNNMKFIFVLVVSVSRSEKVVFALAYFILPDIIMSFLYACV